MQIHCEVCREPLRAEDVHFELSMAKCHACNAVYDLSGRKGRGLAKAPSEQAPLRPRPALPVRFRLEEYDGTTTISWRWFDAGYAIMGVLCLAWFWLLNWVYNSLFDPGSAPVIATVVLWVLRSPGLFFFYGVVAGFLNTTRIEVSRGALRIKHGPVPWWGNFNRPSAELTQLYGQGVEGNNTTTYKLMALDREGREVELLEHLDNAEQALYLERALEGVLGIEDRPVEGELPRRAEVG